MPELPEVETVRAQLDPLVSGSVVTAADSHPSPKFAPAVEAVGSQLLAVRRRGKFLLIDTDDGRELIIHLGMTGVLSLGDGQDPSHPGPADPHLRAWWRLSPDGSDGAERLLTFHDVRRFGRIRVVPAGDHRSLPTLANAGPEPFDPDLDGRRFAELLGRSRRRLKTQLLSQRPVAGVGNIYADEALWLAGIDPRATRLSRARATTLLDAIRTVLRQGIDNGGTTLRDYRTPDGGRGDNQHALNAYGRGGLPCLRCAAPLRSARIDGRTTTWCPRCQSR